MAAKSCTPQFSPQDSDLTALKWRLDHDGYARTSVNARVDGKWVIRNPKAHQLVIERVYGRKSSLREPCDHADGDRLNNQRGNLKLVTHQANSQRRKPMNATGLRGVTFNKSVGKWQAQVGHNGKTHYCGVYSTKEEAAKAAASKRKELGFPEEAA